MKTDKGQNGLIADWYEKYVYAMIHVAMTYVKDPSTAEDIVQTVFEKLLEKKKILHFENEEKCKSFLLKAVKNQCIDYLRKEKVRATYVEEIEKVSDNNGFASQSPLDEIVWKEGCEELQQMMEDKLNSRYRTILYCRYFYGLTLEETGEYIDADQKTTAVWAGRAKSLLREWLEKRIGRKEENK
jgi:RNA polymerase sigma factor (sigma-70 family)